jgi:RNA polymerase sigma-70 factor, ECF subfamily
VDDKHRRQPHGNSSSRQGDVNSSDYVVLIQCVRDGDMAAFRRLYDLTSPRLYGIATRILPDLALAQDALQEGFLRIWRYAHRYDFTLGDPMAWMSTIIRNAALDILAVRRNDRDIESMPQNELPNINPVHPDRVRVNSMLAHIPPDHARAIVAMYTYGFSHPELAEYLGVPLGTVKSWVTRGTSALRERNKK